MWTRIVVDCKDQIDTFDKVKESCSNASPKIDSVCWKLSRRYDPAVNENLLFVTSLS
jgi:hypothetical protein